METRKLNFIKSGLIAGLIIIGAPVTAFAATNSNAGNNVTICHSTGSSSKPYTTVKANPNGIISGHAKHSGDIIPPFTYNDHGTSKNFAGLNWTVTGQAILRNGCVVGGSGGGAGGSGSGDPNSAGQVLGAASAGRGGGTAAQAADGGVDAGFGGASTKVSEFAAAGLVVSAAGILSGLGLLVNRRKV
ncbi:MAG TPA: hypothetical protein VHB51_01650 [Candidatus Saccharimonadales bacterium]|nr:hypothetical protein [Candidatus Saccharimonadales bacterium]